MKRKSTSNRKEGNGDRKTSIGVYYLTMVPSVLTYFDERVAMIPEGEFKRRRERYFVQAHKVKLMIKPNVERGLQRCA